MLIWKKSTTEDAVAQLSGVRDLLASLTIETFDDVALIESEVKKYIEANGLQNGNVLWPMRVALSGSEQSAGPFQIGWVLGKEEALARLTVAIDKLSS